MTDSRIRHQLGGNLEQDMGGMAVVGILALALEPKSAVARRLVGKDGKPNAYTAVWASEESNHCRAKKAIREYSEEVYYERLMLVYAKAIELNVRQRDYHYVCPSSRDRL